MTPITLDRPGPDASIKEHWGYALGICDHGYGVSIDDSPFLPGTPSDRCWRAGWEQAEAEAVAQSHYEKATAEAPYMQERT